MKKNKSADPLRPHSSLLLDGDERAAARAMLYPVGFTKEDFTKPIIGIASTWSNVTPCNMHIDKLALESEKARTPPAARRSSSTPSPSPTASRWAAKA
jgi:dihydroxy-acid dehydratase